MKMQLINVDLWHEHYIVFHIHSNARDRQKKNHLHSPVIKAYNKNILKTKSCNCITMNNDEAIRVVQLDISKLLLD